MNKKLKGRPPEVEISLKKLRSIGVFDTQGARKAGISSSSLNRWVEKEKILRVDKGLYIHPDSKIAAEERDYAIACAKFGPKSIVGGMTALFYYGLIEQVPSKIWVLVPYESRTTNRLYRCVRTKTAPDMGVINHRFYRITNLERTLIEAFRFASKIGIRIAFQAVRIALKEKQTSLTKLHAEAKKLKLEKYIERHWESLIPESQGNR